MVLKVEEALAADVVEEGRQHDVAHAILLHLLVLDQLGAALTLKGHLYVVRARIRKGSLHLGVSRQVLKSNSAPYL